MKTKLTAIIATLTLTAGLALAGTGVPLWVNTNTMDCLPPRSDGGTNNWDDMGGATTGKVDKAGDFDQFTALSGASNTLWISNGNGSGEWVSWSALLTRQAASDPSAAAGNVFTFNFHYDPTEPYAAGTMHVLAYGNAECQNAPLLNETYAIGDLRTQPTVSYTNATWFPAITQVWFYAWFDADANGLFNLTAYTNGVYSPIVAASNYPALEPACVAEFAPSVLDATNDAHDVDFWLVSDKGGYVRFILDPNEIGTHIIAYRNMSVGGAPVIGRATNTVMKGLIEGNYIDSVTLVGSGNYYGGLVITNDNNASLQFLDGSTILFQGEYGYGQDFVLDEAPQDATSQSVPTYPINGATVTAGVVTFAWENAWNYPATQVYVGTNAAFSGSAAYSYSGYMENEHWDDGNTYHRADLSALAPGTYYWVTKALPPMIVGPWPATLQSTTNSFVVVSP
jgi:hypothetical protein